MTAIFRTPKPQGNVQVRKKCTHWSALNLRLDYGDFSMCQKSKGVAGKQGGTSGIYPEDWPGKWRHEDVKMGECQDRISWQPPPLTTEKGLSRQWPGSREGQKPEFQSCRVPELQRPCIKCSVMLNAANLARNTYTPTSPDTCVIFGCLPPSFPRFPTLFGNISLPSGEREC